MSVMDKIERKFGGSRLPNMMFVLVVCYAIGYVVTSILGIEYYLMFLPEKILQGEIWRIITFVFIPSDSSVFMVLITCFIYFSISKSLEQIIGRFRLNFFLILGLVLEILFGFIYYFIFSSNEIMAPYSSYTAYLNPYYLYSMLFVLFAMIFPNAQFLLMFIIPIRGKYMVFITLALCLIDVMQAFIRYQNPAYAWILIFMILAAVAALVIFILLCGYRVGGTPQNVVHIRKTRRQKEFEQATRMQYRHKCAICGRTDVTNPELTFRYCSKCQGNYEYCNEHLYTHVHKTGGNPTL